MERRSTPRFRTAERIKRVAGFLFDHIHAPARESVSNPWHPTIQRDVGKSVARAAEVQLVIHALPVVEKPEAGQLRYSQPLEGFGYLDRPDMPVSPQNRWDSLGNYMDA